LRFAHFGVPLLADFGRFWALFGEFQLAAESATLIEVIAFSDRDFPAACCQPTGDEERSGE